MTRRRSTGSWKEEEVRLSTPEPCPRLQVDLTPKLQDGVDLGPEFVFGELVFGLREEKRRMNKDVEQNDGFSDVSHDSGVNIDQELSLLSQDQDFVLSSPTPDSSSLLDQMDDTGYNLSTEDECGSSDFSDQDDFNDHFVSYKFEDYPESVFCDFEDEPPQTETTRRRSSVRNPSEIYIEKACDCDYKDSVVRRSNSIKSRL